MRERFVRIVRYETAAAAPVFDAGHFRMSGISDDDDVLSRFAALPRQPVYFFHERARGVNDLRARGGDP